MYNFYYNYSKPKYPDLTLPCQDFYAGKHLFDFSEYEKEESAK